MMVLWHLHNRNESKLAVQCFRCAYRNRKVQKDLLDIKLIEHANCCSSCTSAFCSRMRRSLMHAKIGRVFVCVSYVCSCCILTFFSLCVDKGSRWL
jgi:hypothetical protein